MAMGQWVQRFVPKPRSEVRLFCFHHAGGGAAVYRPWAQMSSEEIEVCAIQLPGRGDRLREPALVSVSDIVDNLLPSLRGELDRPFAFFGHSMGAVVAYECARGLCAEGAPAPLHLIVSGRRPPHVPDPKPPLSELPDEAFVAEVNRRYGGIPQELLAHADVMALLLPGLRADIRALDRHVGGMPAAALSCPITAMGGRDDLLTPREHLEAWRALTSSEFGVRLYGGGHFYLDARRAEVFADVSSVVRRAPSFQEQRA